jgi:hypothetical protein
MSFNAESHGNFKRADKRAQWTEKSYFRDTKLIGKINMKLWSMLFIEYRHEISSCCLWLCYKWLILLSAIFSLLPECFECRMCLGSRQRQQYRDECYLTGATGKNLLLPKTPIGLRRGRNWFNFPDNYMEQQGIIFCVIRPSSNVNSKMTNIVSPKRV